MAQVLGIDGAAGGWVSASVAKDPDGAATLKVQVAHGLEDCLTEVREGLVLVDMPIGLPNGPASRRH